MKRRRLRKCAKWACTLAAGAAVALAVFSRFFGFYWDPVLCDGKLSLQVYEVQGLVQVNITRQSTPGTHWISLGASVSRCSGWDFGLAGESSDYRFSENWCAGVLCAKDADGWFVGLSVLYPVALTLIPGALLWYADRRRFVPGSCGGCGYDRAGLAPTSPCPECGTVAHP